MSSREEDNSERMEYDEQNGPFPLRPMVRPAFRWIVVDDDVEVEQANVINNQIDDAATDETASIVLTDSDCFIVESSKKRKLTNEETNSSLSASSAGQSTTQRKKKRLPIEAGESSNAGSQAATAKNIEQWTKLAQPIIVKIMSYLNHLSRLNMALTCKSWSPLIKSACLWRNLGLELSAFKAVEKPIINYVKSHAKHINNVVVTWRRPSYIISTRNQNGLTKILALLKEHAQIFTFRMHYLELDRYWRFETRREKLITALAKFLETQRKMNVFVMNSAQMGLSQGCFVLESIAKLSGAVLLTLNIEDFFQARVASFRLQRYMDLIVCFTNLKNLYINYNCVNDVIVNHFAKSGQLQTFSIKVYKNDPHHHKISPASWNSLRKACSKLEVSFEFDQVPSYMDIAPILIPQIPLRGLYIWSGYVEEDEWGVGETLKHIATNFSKSLETFTLEIENDLELIDAPLLQMVEACKSLRHMDINAVLSTTTVEALCQLQEQGKINLQSLYITLAGVPDSDAQTILDDIRDKYVELIEALNLDFIFTADVISISEVNYVPIDVEQHPDIIIEP